ncbi:rhodanese-like domain-containing protein [Aliiroseovarius lamellibrachiae]|uniref:rhodanese-like domain-containing protein n=1 Tax=Aliiroseovarius lamellibrachiae TaxID=1924933 RepID=UPI001BE06464|nr:rhodanese-like domain-containing protein [Aliiroseovarius lamellibrachiae]MBT2129873.1 rhodanese-like domain-containing protein [Aliiroseovarius lamellibrachiae]
MRFLLLAAACVMAAPAFADGVNIRRDVTTVLVPTAGGDVVIERIQDPAHELRGEWARTSRPCPNFCVQPMVPAPGVTPIGELEMLGFLQDPEVIVVDSRVAKDHAGGSIPGAISIPYNEAADRMDELGCEVDFDGFDCSDAKTVALFCNGNWCGQSPTAIRRMIEAGYPADKINYYRGGMHAWRMLGLTVTDGS